MMAVQDDNVPGYMRNLPERARSPSMIVNTPESMLAGPSYNVDDSVCKKKIKKKKMKKGGNNNSDDDDDDGEDDIQVLDEVKKEIIISDDDEDDACIEFIEVVPRSAKTRTIDANGAISGGRRTRNRNRRSNLGPNPAPENSSSTPISASSDSGNPLLTNNRDGNTAQAAASNVQPPANAAQPPVNAAQPSDTAQPSANANDEAPQAASAQAPPQYLVGGSATPNAPEVNTVLSNQPNVIDVLIPGPIQVLRLYEVKDGVRNVRHELELDAASKAKVANKSPPNKPKSAQTTESLFGEETPRQHNLASPGRRRACRSPSPSASSTTSTTNLGSMDDRDRPRNRGRRNRSPSPVRRHREETSDRQSDDKSRDRDRQSKRKRHDSNSHRDRTYRHASVSSVASRSNPHHDLRNNGKRLSDPTKPEEIIKRILECAQCGKESTSRRDATEHLKKDHNMKHCPVCFFTVSSKGNRWKDHIKKYHSEGLDDESIDKEFTLCPLPECKTLQSYTGLYQHISRKHLILIDGRRNKLSPEKRRNKGREMEKRRPEQDILMRDLFEPPDQPSPPNLRPQEPVASSSRGLGLPRRPPPRTVPGRLENRETTTSLLTPPPPPILPPILSPPHISPQFRQTERPRIAVQVSGSTGIPPKKIRPPAPPPPVISSGGSQFRIPPTPPPILNKTASNPINTSPGQGSLRTAQQMHAPPPSTRSSSHEFLPPRPLLLTRNAANVTNTSSRKGPVSTAQDLPLRTYPAQKSVHQNGQNQTARATRATENPGINQNPRSELSDHIGAAETARLKVLYGQNSQPNGIALQKISQELNLSLLAIKKWFDQKYLKECEQKQRDAAKRKKKY